MHKNYKTIISMMSGTSLDGIDACLLKIFDDLTFEIIDSTSFEYPVEVKNRILLAANNKADTQEICLLNFFVGECFAKCANNLLKKVNIDYLEVDFISSHGQTIFHIPKEFEAGGFMTRSTLQIGDISVISERTGIKTVGDFRTKDIAAGGQGAPLVPFADQILFGNDKNRAIQNIGGISNVTVLSDAIDTFAFDNGPGNMLIDYFMQKLYGRPYDNNGEIASIGIVDKKWLDFLLADEYYDLQPPKTTGREFFNDEYAEKIYLNSPTEKQDVIATLTALTAKTIADSYSKFVLPLVKLDEIVLGGGGAYNKTLKKMLKQYIGNIDIKTHEDFSIPNKLKEALAFAYLGYFTIDNKPNNVPSCTGASRPVVMGKISY